MEIKMSGIYLSVLIISGLWVISEIGLAVYARASKREDVSIQERTSFKRLWLVIIPCTIIGGFWSPQPLGMVKFARAYVMGGGLGLLILGMIIRWKAVFTLRKYFTVEVSIVKNHKVIKRGEYKYIRHPAYAGSLLSFFGLGWALGNWISFLVIFFPILWAFLKRIKVEERMLLTALGEEYANYMKTTRRLIPKIY